MAYRKQHLIKPLTVLRKLSPAVVWGQLSVLSNFPLSASDSKNTDFISNELWEKNKCVTFLTPTIQEQVSGLLCSAMPGFLTAPQTELHQLRTQLHGDVFRFFITSFFIKQRQCFGLLSALLGVFSEKSPTWSIPCEIQGSIDMRFLGPMPILILGSKKIPISDISANILYMTFWVS